MPDIDNNKKSNHLPKMIALVVILILLLITIQVSVQENKRFKTEIRGQIVLQLSQIRQRFESELNRHFYLSRGLIDYINHNKDIDLDTFKSMSKEIIKHSLHIQKIILAPDSKISYVFPFAGNEQHIGIEYSNNKHLWPSIKKIIKNEKSTIKFQINQNSDTHTLVGITPIFLNNSNVKQENYWGIVQIDMDFETLIQNAGINDINSILRISLIEQGKNGSSDTLIFGDSSINKNEAISTIVKAADGHWMLYAEPYLGWQSTSPNQYLLWFIWGSLSLLFGWLVTTRLDIFRQQKRQLKNALSKAQSAEKANSDFIANISHEIRTPLNPIIGLTYLALKEELPEQTKTYLNEIQFASQLLLKTIDSLVDYSKIESGKITIEQKPFSLEQLLDNIKNLYSNQAKEKQLGFEINASENLPQYIIGDQVRMGQVLGNLLSNAIKFTNKGKISLDVTISNFERNKVSLSFIVKDTGIGMTSQQIDELFIGYNQSDSSITREFGGTGLGLSLSKKLIELMDGEIDVSSNPDIGSQFTIEIEFDLLNKEDIHEHVNNHLYQNNEIPQYQNKCIMLVEDNKTNQIVVQNLLKDTGLEIFIANNGQEAVFMSLARRYDLVLMDIQMPVMDGYEATKTIRKKKRYKNVPIIAMTAHASMSDQVKSKKAGMSAHLTKPIDPEIFYKTIMEFLPPIKSISLSSDTQSEKSLMIDSLPGIDSKIGLKNVLQDHDLYIKILFEFQQDHTNDVHTINQCIKENNLKKAKSMAHTIKGSAGHIGANNLYEQANYLENYFNTKNSSEISMHEFILAFEEVMGGIDALKETLDVKSEDIQSEIEISENESGLIMEKLSEKLQQASPQARDHIPKLKQICGKKHNKSIIKIEESIDIFDFEEALKLLEILKKEMT